MPRQQAAQRVIRHRRSLAPALRIGGRTGFAALRSGARAGHRTAVRKMLLTIEVAVSVALLIASGLLIRAMWRVQAVDPGFSPAAVLTMQTDLPSPRYDDPARRIATTLLGRRRWWIARRFARIVG